MLCRIWLRDVPAKDCVIQLNLLDSLKTVSRCAQSVAPYCNGNAFVNVVLQADDRYVTGSPVEPEMHCPKSNNLGQIAADVILLHSQLANAFLPWRDGLVQSGAAVRHLRFGQRELNEPQVLQCIATHG